MNRRNNFQWLLLLTPGKDFGLVGFIHAIHPSRFFLSSFSKIENGEKARLLLIEKVKAAVASGVEEPVVHGDRRYLMHLSLNTVKSVCSRSSTPSLEEDEESWAVMAKRRKVERQQEVN